MKILSKFQNMSVERKLNLLRMLAVVPLSAAIIALLILMINFNEEYNEIVKNVTMASKFNFSFSDDIDYKMYRIVIGAEDFEELDPYADIKEARNIFEQLYENATTEEGKIRTLQIRKLLDNLEKSIKEIEASDEKNDYPQNNQRLTLNVNVFTEIIKDKVSQYIYYETGNLEKLKSELETQIMQTIVATAIILCVVILLIWKLGHMITDSIIQPIDELCDMTKEVAAGNFELSGPSNTSEELQILTQNFEYMANQVGLLIDNIKEEQENLRKKELQLLQEQINPHFLYNTLDTIVWLAIDHQDDKVVEMVTSLSSFFRTSLSGGEDMVPIREELKHVESYLQIQQLRYGDIMEYRIEVPEEIQGNYMIKMTLQPLVENALYHGLKMQRSKGFIQINGTEDEDNIYLTVEDNGIGMSPEQVEELNRGMVENKWSRRKNGFGIFNVNRRNKLYFGDAYQLILESEPGIGTKVIVVVPKNIQVKHGGFKK